MGQDIVSKMKIKKKYLIIIAAVFVIAGISLVLLPRIRERSQFDTLNEKMDPLLLRANSQFNTNVEETKGCGRRSAKYSKGELVCHRSVSISYPSIDTKTAESRLLEFDGLINEQGFSRKTAHISPHFSDTNTVQSRVSNYQTYTYDLEGTDFSCVLIADYQAMDASRTATENSYIFTASFGCDQPSHAKYYPMSAT